MEKPLVSVIIPVYNAEAYLEQCLESVLRQTLGSIEIICVNDGSRDRSWDLLQLYAPDDRVKLFNLPENCGGAYARNFGMEHASGKYLSFLDADDFFEPDMLRAASALAEERNLDEVLFDAWYYSSTLGMNKAVSYVVEKHFLPSQEVFSYQDIPEGIFQITTTCVWNKLYRRRMIEDNHIQFIGQYHQEPCVDDVFFSMIASVSAHRIGVLQQRFIHYRVDNPSGQEHVSANQYMRCYYAGMAVRDKLMKMGLYAAVEKSFLNRVWSLCACALDSVNNTAAFEAYYRELKERIIPDLGLADKDASFFYSDTDYRKLQRVQQETAAGYLFNELGQLRKMGLIDGKFYPLPFSELLQYRRVVLYGAGDVGVSYYRQLVCAKCFEIVLWVDRQYDTVGNRMPVSSPEDIPKYEYDCVMIAVQDQNTAGGIRRFLRSLGVEEKKIFWHVR